MPAYSPRAFSGVTQYFGPFHGNASSYQLMHLRFRKGPLFPDVSSQAAAYPFIQRGGYCLGYTYSVVSPPASQVLVYLFYYLLCAFSTFPCRKCTHLFTEPFQALFVYTNARAPHKSCNTKTKIFTNPWSGDTAFSFIHF